MGTRQGPSSAGYWAAAALGVIAAVVAAVVVVQAIRAFTGFDVRPLTSSTSDDVTIEDRPIAIWFDPPSAGGRCSLLDSQGVDRSVERSVDLTISTNGHRWGRTFVVDGPPGTRVHVRCSEIEQGTTIGWSEEPQTARRVFTTIGGLALAGVIGVAALVLLVVTAVRRGRPPRATAPTWTGRS